MGFHFHLESFSALKKMILRHKVAICLKFNKKLPFLHLRGFISFVAITSEKNLKKKTFQGNDLSSNEIEDGSENLTDASLPVYLQV